MFRGGLFVLLVFSFLSTSAFADDFATRLASDSTYLLPKQGLTVQKKFLCFVEDVTGDFGSGDDSKDPYTQNNCLNGSSAGLNKLQTKYGINSAKITFVQDLLVQWFNDAPPVLQKLLMHPNMKFIQIEIGGMVNASSYGVIQGKKNGKDVYYYALGLNYAIFGLNPQNGFETFVGYYEAFQSLKGGLDFRRKVLLEGLHYETMPLGPITQADLYPSADPRLRGALGVLMKVAYHELGHFSIQFMDPLAIDSETFTEAWSSRALPAQYESNEIKTEADFAKLIYTDAPFTKANKDYNFADPDLARIRETLCFGRGAQCESKKHSAGEMSFVSDLIQMYSGSGVFSAVGTWTPAEAYAEWLSLLQIEKHFQSIRIYPAPQTSSHYVDILEQTRAEKYPQRAAIQKYIDYRLDLFDKYLDETR